MSQNKEKNKKIVDMVHESREKLEKIEIDIKPPKVEPLVPPTPLPPLPVFSPEMIPQKEMKDMMKDTDSEKALFNHLRFPSEIRIIGADFQYDVLTLVGLGGMLVGFALGSLR